MKAIKTFQRHQKILWIAGLAVILSIALWPAAHDQPVAAANVTVSAEQLNAYIRDWSEPEGYFDSDNFISNETSYEHIIDQLRSKTRPGGVYIGVGPDQNFTYIAHTRPALAVIIDIRRQNMLQHLFYKALFQQASSRSDYLALWLAREKPSVPASANIEDILKAVRGAATSEALFKQRMASLRSILVETDKLSLTREDLQKIEYVYHSFWQDGLDLRFSSIGRGNAMQYPTLEDLILETDQAGRKQSYLASDELFQWLKKFESENRLIPIVGDFGGDHAFREVGRFLKDNGLPVSTFYTSNVEFYLFGTPSWTAFMKNVHALPLNGDSLFIRAYFSTYGRIHPLNVRGHRSTTLIDPIVPFLNDYDAGRIPTYWEVVQRSR